MSFSSVKGGALKGAHYVRRQSCHACTYTPIVSCQSVVQLGGPVFKYYWTVPTRWGCVSSVLLTIVV